MRCEQVEQVFRFRRGIVTMLIGVVVAAVFAAVPGNIAWSLSYTDDDTVNLMYRVYNPNSGEHFYTADVQERSNLVMHGWKNEGIAWAAPKHSDTPVYRLYSGTDHHYTPSAEERDSLVRSGWTYEGVGWYSDDAEGVPLYRQFNPHVNPSASTNNSGSHNYTTSTGENDYLVSAGWKAEGIGWYGKSIHVHSWKNTGQKELVGKKYYYIYQCRDCGEEVYYRPIF